MKKINIIYYQRYIYTYAYTQMRCSGSFVSYCEKLLKTQMSVTGNDYMDMVY